MAVFPLWNDTTTDDQDIRCAMLLRLIDQLGNQNLASDPVTPRQAPSDKEMSF